MSDRANNYPLVCYRNEINRAGLRLDITETRIVLVALSKIGTAVRPDVFYDVSAQDLIAVGAGPETAYKQLQDAANTLFDRYITINERDAKGADRATIHFRWVSAVKYSRGEGKISVMFSSPLIPYLESLRTEFTQLPLTDIKDLSTPYAIRIYCMLMQFASTGWMSIDVDDLKHRLQIQEKFPLYGDFKRRILIPSLKAINRAPSSRLLVSLVERKEGRKVVALRFAFSHKISSNDSGRIKLSDRQIAMYADLLSGRNDSARTKYPDFHPGEFVSFCREVPGCDLSGLSYYDAALKIRQLLSDEEKAFVFLPFLTALGFRPSEQQKKTLRSNINTDTVNIRVETIGTSLKKKSTASVSAQADLDLPDQEQNQEVIEGEWKERKVKSRKPKTPFQQALLNLALAVDACLLVYNCYDLWKLLA